MRAEMSWRNGSTYLEMPHEYQVDRKHSQNERVMLPVSTSIPRHSLFVPAGKLQSRIKFRRDR